MYNLPIIDYTGSYITRQYIHIVDNGPIEIAEFNTHGNLYDVHGNWGGLSYVYREVIMRYTEVRHID